MATSTTDLANRALRLIKAQSITSLTDGSKNANVANEVYDGVWEDVLRSGHWHFARKLVKLARNATAPAFEFTYAYTLPSDWVRTISVHDNDAGSGNLNYEEAEVDDVGVLMSGAENVYLKYVYRVTDPNRAPADFQTAFVYALAVAMPGISNISAAAWDNLERQAARRLNKAKSSSSLGSPPPKRPAGSWATSRQSWPSSRWPR